MIQLANFLHNLIFSIYLKINLASKNNCKMAEDRKSNRASVPWPFRKNSDKFCNMCDKKFGIFDKKRVCWECQFSYCSKCVKRVHDNKYSVLRTKKYCLNCYEKYRISKMPDVAETRDRRLSSEVVIGNPQNVSQELHVT